MPVLGISVFVTSYMFTKAATFGFGIGFFGDPVITRGLDWLNRTFPDWQKLLELRKLVLPLDDAASLHDTYLHTVPFLRASLLMPS